MLLVRIAIWIVVAALVVTAIMPSIPTDSWAVRMADFPRLQLLIVAILVVLIAGFLARGHAALVLAAIAAGIVATIHGVTLWSWLVPQGRALVCAADADRLRIVVANVRMTNEPDNRLADFVRQAEPDLFLTLETNEQWVTALSSLQTVLPYQIEQPASNYYGMMLMSRQPLPDGKVIFPADAGTPSIVATVPLASGGETLFQALHPRPPHPGQSAAARDAQILASAESLAAAGDFVLAGDLNATPWETTIQTGGEIAGWQHPRHVFGFSATYSAQSWWRHWPLDYILPSPQWQVSRFEVLPEFGSDHYPLMADLCRTP